MPSAEQVVKHLHNISACFGADQSQKISEDKSQLLGDVMVAVYKLMQETCMGDSYASLQLKDTNCVLIGSFTVCI